MGGGAGLKEDSWAEGKPDGLVLVLVLFFFLKPDGRLVGGKPAVCY